MLAAINAVNVAKVRGMVTLRDLCDELHAEPVAARARLRHARVKTTDGAYVWDKDGDDLKRVARHPRWLATLFYVRF